jgi:PadR family transcriptional regulator PadR
MYGYELVKELESRSGNEFSVKEGTLYPALHKLEKQEYIECYWKEQEKGPARKYYKITDAGKEMLLEKTREWNDFVSVMNKMMGRKKHGTAEE